MTLAHEAIPARPAAVLRARDLECSLGQRRVLNAVSLELAHGQLLAVIGPNGAGKSTLLRCLCGVVQPHAGVIELHARSLARWPLRERARALAVVPQELAVSFPYRVREMVAMGRAPHLGALGHEGPSDAAAVAEALAELGLCGLAERFYPTLSGGERQRVALARARAQQAPCLLLDEPTAHMDLGHRLHAFEWLRGWLAQAPNIHAALVVTHELDLAARFADRVVLLAQGRVVAAGRPSEVLTSDTLAEVYQADVCVRLDENGRPVIVAERSRIVYTPSLHEQNQSSLRARDP